VGRLDKNTVKSISARLHTLAGRIATGVHQKCDWFDISTVYVSYSSDEPDGDMSYTIVGRGLSLHYPDSVEYHKIVETVQKTGVWKLEIAREEIIEVLNIRLVAIHNNEVIADTIKNLQLVTAALESCVSTLKVFVPIKSLELVEMDSFKVGNVVFRPTLETDFQDFTYSEAITEKEVRLDLVGRMCAVRACSEM
jgi:hypothetical protein